ncbi:metabotropic glycine receptor [Anabrus simplex]|uniref:metabotropic glycine receptor n=1 Tax=Anabrus simplex TaxID=316456 RepID=UPI0035A2B372
MLAAAASALLLLLVADAKGSADADNCIPLVLPNPISWEAVPIHLRHLAEDAVRVLADAISSDLESAVSLVLRKHSELEAVAIRVNSSAQSLEVVQYRREDGESNSTMDTFWELLDQAEANESGGWSRPFNDCPSGKWLFGYTVLFAEPLRGTAWVLLPLERLEVTQCNESFSRVFGASHSCDLKSTECIPADGSGQRAGYTCVCRPGYWRDPEIRRGIGDPHSCVPCDSTVDAGCRLVRPDFLLRTVVLGVQLLCMSITVVLALVVFRQRKCKAIASGMWTILETILLGIFLLYSTVVVRFFDPSVELCLLEPWCRELGFVICYGAIILKLYRILIEFRTRKAHRWVVRDKDLLKYLLGMVLVVLGYMAAWTASNLNFIQENYSILAQGRTHEGLQFLACKALWWDYVTETGEILILVFGIHLSYACRNATTQFQERRFLCLAIAVEASVSGIFYVLRILFHATLHPDYSYLAYFTRSQLTNTAVLLLIFMPKLWYQHRGTRHYLPHEFSTRAPLDAFKPQDGVTGTNSDVDVGEINLADMNPEDIRAELKRLYTQLEILKNKTIRADNPHISKRRGGRKVAHRRFSLQKKGSREKALHHRQQRCSTRHHATTSDAEMPEGEVSRTPEDSVCSNEGPSAIYNDAPSTYSELVGCGTPNVSFRVSQRQ